MKLQLFLSLCTMALNAELLNVTKKTLHTPPLEELCSVLQKSLAQYFKEVNVEVVDCPNLKEEPFTLVAEGLGGSERLVDVGGPPYLLPLVDRSKVYDLKDIAKLIGVPNAFLIGAGAGPFPYAGTNCEGIINFKIENNTFIQGTRIAKIVLDEKEKLIEEQLPSTETRFALLANFFVSEGKPGKVLKIHTKQRIGSLDFIASIRTCLAQEYKNKMVGLGGAWLLKEGQAKQHVMRDFSTTPINTEEQLNKWLKFINMSAPLIALGTLVTEDGGLDLRLQHFHSFSHHGEGGHYHIDVTPDTVEYFGYFTLGKEIYRIDPPPVTHSFGRD